MIPFLYYASVGIGVVNEEQETEGVAVAEAATWSVLLTLPNDGITLAEAQAAHILAAGQRTEGVILSEFQSLIHRRPVAGTEGTVLAEAHAVHIEAHPQLDEDVLLSEQQALRLIAAAQITEGITLAEAQTMVLLVAPQAVTEGVTLSEQQQMVLVGAPIGVQGTEVALFAEQQSLLATLGQQVAEGVVLVEAQSMQRFGAPAEEQATEGVTFSELLTWTFGATFPNDGVLLAEAQAMVLIPASGDTFPVQGTEGVRIAEAQRLHLPVAGFASTEGIRIAEAQSLRIRVPEVVFFLKGRGRVTPGIGRARGSSTQ